MKHLKKILVVLSLVLISVSDVHAENIHVGIGEDTSELEITNRDMWSQLKYEDVSESSLCTGALKIAETHYKSDNSYLYIILKVPENFTSKLVLRPSGYDISGGNALIEDQSVFQKFSKRYNYTSNNIFW